MKYMHSAGIIVYRYNDDRIEYLLLQYGAGHWDFPKGKLEAGESKRQAAHRELMEEAGLTASIDEGFSESFDYFFTDYDGKPAHKTVTFFVGQAASNNVVLSHEHTDFKWLPYERAAEQVTHTNARQVLRKADSFLTS